MFFLKVVKLETSHRTPYRSRQNKYTRCGGICQPFVLKLNLKRSPSKVSHMLPIGAMCITKNTSYLWEANRNIRMHPTWILRPEHPEHLEVSCHTKAIRTYFPTHGFLPGFWMHLSAPSYIQIHHWFTLPPEYTLDSPCLGYAFPDFCHS